MPSVTNDNFGPLVAYLVPGATALAGLSRFSSTLPGWFAVASADAPSIGGFLYLTVASLAAGMTMSAIRWVLVDTLLFLTGVKPSPLDFSRLGENVAAFALLIESHYRHYLFFGNMFVAVAFAYACYRVDLGRLLPLGWIDLGVLLLEAAFFASARDTLHKYYVRSGQLLRASRRGRR